MVSLRSALWCCAAHSFWRRLIGSAGKFFFLKQHIYPERVNIYPTLRCNLGCAHCYFRVAESSWSRSFCELPTAQWLKIINDLRKWLGPFRLTITGGEPFLREDIPAIIKRAHQRDIFTCINTNGTLITDRLARDLQQSGIDMIFVSLDGSQMGHDAVRGPEVYRRVIDALTVMRQFGLRTYLTTTIMKTNLKEIPEIVSVAQAFNSPVFFQGLFLTNRNRHLWPEEIGAVTDAFEFLLRQKRRNRFIASSVANLQSLLVYYRGGHGTSAPCVVYRDWLKIKPNGGLSACEDFAYDGNITSDDMRLIWDSRENRQVRLHMKECKKNCSYQRCYYTDSLAEQIEKMLLFMKS